MTSNQLLAYLRDNVSGTGLVPVYMEADIFYGQVYYFVNFERRTGVAWAIEHGLSDTSFASRGQELAGQGFRLVHQQRLTEGGRVRNLGIWYR